MLSLEGKTHYLGDGFFDAARFMRAGGQLCVGSDSQATVAPAEELRWMEYQQRLRKRRRGVLADKSEPHVGTRLWSHAAEAGARALGQPAGAIAVGRRADWLVLDRDHPSMAGAPLENALDHLVFAAGDAAIRDVMVAGLNAIPGVTCRKPEGAFYAFADCRGLYGIPYAGRTIASDEDVAFFFLEHAHVATVPGGPFGAPGYVRFSYATSEDRIALGLASIRRAIDGASAAPVQRAAQA